MAGETAGTRAKWSGRQLALGPQVRGDIIWWGGGCNPAHLATIVVTKEKYHNIIS